MSEAIGDFLRTPAPWLLIPYATCPSFPATMLLRMTMCGWVGYVGGCLRFGCGQFGLSVATATSTTSLSASGVMILRDELSGP